LIIAPEGTRSKSGQIQDLKKGPFYMQRDLGGVDVLPIVLTGNHEAWQGASGIRMCRVRLEYLAPLKCPKYEGSDLLDEAALDRNKQSME
jgi:1-acyl-sn-glycerol-3-phosphate acyltransferase